MAVRLGQVPREVPTLTDGTALSHQLLAKPIPQRLQQSASAIGHKENPPGKQHAATLQAPEDRLADLVIFRGALPEPERHLFPDDVHPQGDEKRLAASMDRVEKERKRCEVLQRPLSDRRELGYHQVDELARGRSGGHTKSVGRVKNGVGLPLD